MGGVSVGGHYLETNGKMAGKSKQFDASAVGSDDYLSALNRRLEVLERRLVGQHGFKPDQPPLKETLGTLEKKLAVGFAKKDEVSTLWSKISALERVLDPKYLSTITLPDSAKSELLIGYAAQLKDLSKPIEELVQLKDYLNVTEFQGLETHEKKLTSVATVHSQQELQVEALAQQVHQLLTAYNRIMLQLSAQLVEWGEAAKTKQ